MFVCVYAESAAQCPEVKLQHFNTAQRNREDMKPFEAFRVSKVITVVHY